MIPLWILPLCCAPPRLPQEVVADALAWLPVAPGLAGWTPFRGVREDGDDLLVLTDQESLRVGPDGRVTRAAMDHIVDPEVRERLRAQDEPAPASRGGGGCMDPGLGAMRSPRQTEAQIRDALWSVATGGMSTPRISVTRTSAPWTVSAYDGGAVRWRWGDGPERTLLLALPDPGLRAVDLQITPADEAEITWGPAWGAWDAAAKEVRWHPDQALVTVVALRAGAEAVARRQPRDLRSLVLPLWWDLLAVPLRSSEGPLVQTGATLAWLRDGELVPDLEPGAVRHVAVTEDCSVRAVGDGLYRREGGAWVPVLRRVARDAAWSPPLVQRGAGSLAVNAAAFQEGERWCGLLDRPDPFVQVQGDCAGWTGITTSGEVWRGVGSAGQRLDVPVGEAAAVVQGRTGLWVGGSQGVALETRDGWRPRALPEPVLAFDVWEDGETPVIWSAGATRLCRSEGAELTCLPLPEAGWISKVVARDGLAWVVADQEIWRLDLEGGRSLEGRGDRVDDPSRNLLWRWVASRNPGTEPQQLCADRPDGAVTLRCWDLPDLALTHAVLDRGGPDTLTLSAPGGQRVLIHLR